MLGEYLYCVGGYDGRDRAVATVERLHLRGDRWEPVADMNKVSREYWGETSVLEKESKLATLLGFSPLDQIPK